MHTLPIHEHLRSKLCDLYENDCIFDKFEVAVNGTGSYVACASGPFLGWSRSWWRRGCGDVVGG